MRHTQSELISIVTSDAAFGVAMRIVRNREAAEDVVQETALRVLRFGHRYEPRPGGSAKAWVFTILRNTALNELARRKRHASRIVPATERECTPGEVPIDEAVDMALRVDEALFDLDRIHPVHAEVVRCRHIADLSIRETAAALSIAEGTVMSGTLRGLAALRNLAA